MRLKRSEQGDTLIEVLVAVVALSVIVTLAYTIMTRSFAQGQIALERTTTQGMVAAQIAMLRDIYARHEQAVQSGASATSTKWYDIVKTDGYVKTYTSEADLRNNSGVLEPCVFGSDTDKQFYFNPTSGPTSGVEVLLFTAAKREREGTFPSYGDGLWIEGYKIAQTNQKPYYDFYVKACWDAAISGERQTVVTNVRFYDIYQ